MLKKTGSLLLGLFLVLTPLAWAEVSVETAVNRARVNLGDELVLDIIITNAEGQIMRPELGRMDGFSSYSQGSTQEVEFTNGQKTSRSIFSFVLIANAEGKKTIGPINVKIGGKNFSAPSVDVEVLPESRAAAPSASNSNPPQAGAGAYAWSPQSQPGTVSDDDLFVRTWLDKNDVYVNEQVVLTYTIYTRLSATYKGFEKEPVTTNFWVEDFPPEKNPSKTQQMLNGSRYVTADIRRIALFPTQAGESTIDTGVIATNVEMRDDFDQFFSTNVFGRRNAFPRAFATQVISRSVTPQPVTLKIKPLPEAGKPATFLGAVGQYKIESSIDKTEVEVGVPVTFRVKISGQGNINTLQMPALPVVPDAKVYDSSSSVNINKGRQAVEGEKVVDTVLVPRKEGTLTIPPVKFSYFDPRTGSYQEIQTTSHSIQVKPGSEPEETFSKNTATPEAVNQEDVSFLAQDIRFIKKSVSAPPFLGYGIHREPVFWVVNGLFLLLSLAMMALTARRQNAMDDLMGMRFKNPGAAAKARLKKAHVFLKKNSHDEFYSEVSKGIHTYFSEKLDLPVTRLDENSIQEALGVFKESETLAHQTHVFFEELHFGQYARSEKDQEEMKKVHEMALALVQAVEKAKRK